MRYAKLRYGLDRAAARFFNLRARRGIGFGPTISRIFGQIFSLYFLVTQTLMLCGGGPCRHE